MSEQNEAIRRQLGIDLVAAERRLQKATRSQTRERLANYELPDQRKQQDEQCQGVDGELLKGIVLGAQNLYFTSLDDVLAWCDAQDKQNP